MNRITEPSTRTKGEGTPTLLFVPSLSGKDNVAIRTNLNDVMNEKINRFLKVAVQWRESKYE